MSPGPRLALGVDLGGTGCKVAVVDEAGAILAEERFATPAGPEATVAAIAAARGRLEASAGRPVGAVGIGSPGPLSQESGIVLDAPNLGWREVPLRDLVARATGRPVLLENDANAAAWGETWAGSGRDARCLLMVTLGTGIGGGLVADGRIFRGARGRALEIGHQVVEPGGRACGCGRRGCVEAYFGGRAIAAQHAERTGEEGTRQAEIFRRWAAGEPGIAAWLDPALDRLARAVAAAGVLFDPDRIVFTGGLTGSWAAFGGRLAAAVAEGLGPEPPRIGLSSLDGRAGVIGAAGLALAG